jgi:hypothetical protein
MDEPKSAEATANKYTAVVEVTGGRSARPWKLEFDYTAQAAITVDGDQFAMLRKTSVAATRAAVLLAGMKRHHPSVTLADVMEESIPAVVAINAINLAWAYAQWGAEGPPKDKDDDQSPPGPAAPAIEQPAP